jgi:hypothetical protein
LIASEISGLESQMDLVEKKFRNLEIEVELERLKEKMQCSKTGNHRTKSQTNERYDPSRNDKISQCYKILCLQPFASLEEVKRAYRDHVEVWHPDRFAHNPRLKSG